MSERPALFLTRTLAIGGAERQLVALANGLAERGHRIVVASLYDDLPLAELLRPSVDVIPLGKRHRWDLLAFVARLGRIVRRLRPSLLHGWNVMPNLVVTGLRSIAAQSRIVWGVRASNLDLSQYDWAARATFWASRPLSRCADLIVTNSRAGFEYHARMGYPRRLMTVVPNGIDLDRFRPDPGGAAELRRSWRVADGETVVGMVARLDPIKDHATFFRAIARLRARGQRIRAVCIGRGVTGAESDRRELLAELGLLGQVRFRERELNLAAAYSAFDVHCLTSRSEGFPNVVAEAMACGTPCVVTDVGDCAEIVGSSGRVVAPGNAAAVADGLMQVAERRDDRRALRARIATEFGLARFVERSERLLFGNGTGG